MSGPPVVCVVGKKKSGKTTTVVGLVAELARRGHDVMTVKHGHGFDLDRAGSDSWKHRHEGRASRVVVSGPGDFAVMGRWGPRPARDEALDEADGAEGDARPDGEAPLEALVGTFLADADVVVAEGFKASAYPRIEVFRSAIHPEPLYSEALSDRYLAVLTDVPAFPARCPVFDVDDPDRFARLADLMESHVKRWSAT